jgi:hypothetical protein
LADVAPGSSARALPVDRKRALTLLDESFDLATREDLPEGVAITEFWRGIVLFTRRSYADAAAAWRRALVANHDRGNRRGMTNVLSCVTGLADRTGRPEAAALLLASLRAARDEFGLHGSENERYAEHRVEEHLRARAGTDGAGLEGRKLDVESTVDLAVEILDQIAANEPA